jgi:hypothetical protein
MPTMRNSIRLPTVDAATGLRGADGGETMWSVLGVFMQGW